MVCMLIDRLRRSRCSDTPARARLAPYSVVATPRGGGEVAEPAERGDGSDEEPRYIVLHSRAIRPSHARLRSEPRVNGSHSISLFAEPGGVVFVNGAFVSPTSAGVVLAHGDRVVFGSHHVFVYQEPSVTGKGSVKAAEDDAAGGTIKDPATLGSTWQEAIKELESHG